MNVDATVKEWQSMKRFLQASFVILTIAVSSRAAEPSADVKEAVLSAEQAWKEAVLKGDRNTLDKLLGDDLSYTHSSSKTQTKEQFIQDITGGGTVYKSIEFDNTKLREYGSVVVMNQSVMITTVQTGVSHLYLTIVWAQQAGRWQMVSRQATKLP
jgi:hypothetical protein